MATATTQKATRKQMKAAIKAKSYSDRRAWWSEQMRLRTLPVNECQAEIRSIDKALARIENEVPSSTWLDDVRMIRPARGGQWPVDGMVRARGERRLYPPSYITTSGYSYDVYLQDVYLDTRQHLLPEEGYMGSVVTIYDLPRRERERLRSREADVQRRGQYRTMTGVL